MGSLTVKATHANKKLPMQIPEKRIGFRMLTVNGRTFFRFGKRTGPAKPVVSFLLSWMLIILSSGCVLKPADSAAPGYAGPAEYTFAGNYAETWKAVIMAIAENDIIKLMDRNTGTAVTESGSINAETLFLVRPYTGQSYRYAYTVNLTELPAAETTVRVDVKLLDNLSLLFTGEPDRTSIANYLRARLFAGICRKLEAEECGNAFYLPVAAHNPAGQNEKKDRECARPQSRTEPQIMELQRKLTAAGYDPGAIDGYMGENTAHAVREFQADHNLPVTGRLSDRLLTALDLQEDALPKKESPPTLPAEEAAAPLQDSPPFQTALPTLQSDPVSPETVDSGRTGIVLEETFIKVSADPFSETVMSIAGGSLVEILDSSSSWAKVRFNGKEGYILYDLISDRGRQQEVSVHDLEARNLEPIH